MWLPFLLWLLFLAASCALDYSYVHGSQHDALWIDPIVPIAVFYAAVLFANRGRFSGITNKAVRWCAIAVISLLIAWLGLSLLRVYPEMICLFS